MTGPLVIESPLLELPEIHVRGTPRDLGRAQGESLRDTIGAFVLQRLDAVQQYLDERGEGEWSGEFVAAGGACLEVARRFHPDGVSEHEGIAEAAAIDPALLYAVTNMTDLRDVLVLPAALVQEGCTSLLLPPELTRERLVIAGQTWDLNPTDLEFVVAIHRLPFEGPETWSVTCAGSLSLIGMNATGLCVGTTNIKTRASRIGVGYLTILHRALTSDSRDQTLEHIRSAPRAAAHTYWVADADAARQLECDPLAVVERPLRHAAIVQTNHCQAPELSDREGEPPTPSSRARLSRATQVLATGIHDLASVQTLFANREDGVNSINRYEEDQTGTTTNACLVCLPARAEIFACRGPADRGRWKHLAFTGR